MYFTLHSPISYFFGDSKTKNWRVNIISNDSRQFFWLKVLKISKFLESNQFMFSRKTCFLSNLLFISAKFNNWEFFRLLVLHLN